MADEFTDVEYTGWGSKIMNSIGGVVIGILLFIVSFPILFWNEGRAVHTAQDLAEGKGNVVSIADASKLDSAAEGKLVHLTGKADTTAELKDDKFGVQALAIRLVREVEMYQWQQEQKKEKKKKLGGGEQTVTKTTYKKVWSAEPIASDTFKYPKGHTNPPMPYKSETWTADKVTLGAYKLTPDLVKQISGDTKIPSVKETLDSVPETLRGKLQLKDGYLYQAAPQDAAASKEKAAATEDSGGGDYAVDEPDSAPGATLGDVRIQFKMVKPATVSIVSRLRGDTFEPYKAGSGTTIDRLMMGDKSAAAMFEQMESENAMLTWILRLVGFVLMAVGIALCFQPLVAIADVIPIMGDILGAGTVIVAIGLALPLALITIALGWVTYRPLVGIPLLVVAVGGLVGLTMLGRSRRAAKAGAQS